MRSNRLPRFILDVFADRRASLGLLASCLALLAAGLDPHVLDAGTVRGRAILAEAPSLELLFTVAALTQAGFLLVGGAVADIWRSERLLRWALIGLAVASAGATVLPQGPGLVASRLLAWACDGLIIPFAIGAVAQLYRQETRATALGILFAVYGAGSVLAPTLVTIFGPEGPEIQAFALCAGFALAAVWATSRWLPDLPGAQPSQRPFIAATALWAFGVVVAVDGLVQLESWLLVSGAIIIVIALLALRLAGGPAGEGVLARPAGAALASGLVIGFSQSVPLIVLPAFFLVVQGLDPLLANVLIAPFILALLAAGPLAGWLLGHFSPRVVIIGGVWAIAVADLAFVVFLAPGSPYPLFIVPFLLVGAGFAVSTAIRTAVIFASTPRRLPATAAALNEASLGVGARLGTTLVVLARSGAFSEGSELYWLQICLLIAAIVAATGGVVVFLLLGPHDPVRTVWELRDERPGS